MCYTYCTYDAGSDEKMVGKSIVPKREFRNMGSDR